jgi:hypothetical protein
MSIHSIEYQWQEFLKRIGLDEKKMPEAQRREMKRTFFGAWAQQIFFMRDELYMHPERSAAIIIKSQLDEAEAFWNNELYKQSGKAN